MNIVLMDDPVIVELIYVDQYFLEIFNFNLLAHQSFRKNCFGQCSASLVGGCHCWNDQFVNSERIAIHFSRTKAFDFTTCFILVEI